MQDPIVSALFRQLKNNKWFELSDFGINAVHIRRAGGIFKQLLPKNAYTNRYSHFKILRPKRYYAKTKEKRLKKKREENK